VSALAISQHLAPERRNRRQESRRKQEQADTSPPVFLKLKSRGEPQSRTELVRASACLARLRLLHSSVA